MLKIGLTGGIGSGKTAASDHFATLGAEVIDTDLLSRELVEPGQPALQAIVEAFGNDDPAQLTARSTAAACAIGCLPIAPPARRSRTFCTRGSAQRCWRARNAQTHPTSSSSFRLLLETGQQHLVDRILLIDVPEAIQRQRVAARDRLERRADHADSRRHSPTAAPACGTPMI